MSERSLSQWGWVFILVSSWILGLAGSSFYAPSMPAVLKSFPGSEVYIKLSISFFLLGKGLSMLFYSPFIERFRRKMFLQLGIVIFVCGSFLAVISLNITMLLMARLIEGIGVSLCILMGRALVNDHFQALRDMERRSRSRVDRSRPAI